MPTVHQLIPRLSLKPTSTLGVTPDSWQLVFGLGMRISENHVSFAVDGGTNSTGSCECYAIAQPHVQGLLIHVHGVGAWEHEGLPASLMPDGRNAI